MYGYRIADQGTNWGTSFPGDTGKFKGRISEKALGLGVSSSFLGGSAAGVAGTMATYSVYHRCIRSARKNVLFMIRYYEFQRLMYMNNPSSFNGMLFEGNLERRGPQNPRPREFSLDDDFYSKYYSRLESSSTHFDLLKNISRNLCRLGCPPNSHCEWGFCECDVGLVKTYVSSVS